MRATTLTTITLTMLHILLLLITITGSIAQAANITVRTSHSPVALDDSFNLTYEASSSVDDDPDFTPVHKDFDVLSTSQSTNVRSINGSWESKKTWQLYVIAKKVGRFTVPAISFGKDVSPAIQITVVNSPAANSPSNKSASPGTSSSSARASIPAQIFLESSVDKKTGWVQSQLIYKIRLFRTVNIVSASITEPSVTDTDAIIQSIGEDRYQTTRNGIRYEVIERSYAIFPQNSGSMTINPVTFEGRIQRTQPRDIFDQFRMSGQLKRLRSQAIEVKIKAAPATIKLQDWLPANSLQLIEEWSDDITDLKAGEPITRTVTIVAQGLTSVQLPELNFEDTQGLKQYPDKAVVEDRKDKESITGLKQFKVALIPASAGRYILPEIKLEWWDTKTNKKAIATLPQVELTVSGSVNTNSNIPSIPIQAQNTTAATSDEPAILTAAGTDSNNASYWKWLSIAFALAWLITLFLYYKKTLKGSPQITNKNKSSYISLKVATSNVNKHAQQNKTKETRDALIKWAQLFYENNTISNLTQITKLCSPRLKQAIRELNQVLYSSDASHWQGSDLLNAFESEQLLSDLQKDSQPSALKPLYKNT